MSTDVGKFKICKVVKEADDPGNGGCYSSRFDQNSRPHGPIKLMHKIKHLRNLVKVNLLT